MDTKKGISPAILAAAVALLLVFIGFMAYRSLRGGDNNESAPGGTAAKTVAPVEQRYPDGTAVPYNAAPTGATPGNPASVGR